ncbi:MAG: EAL domain-containing protein [Oscillospiraceae bacterium]|nr:EAL domain-containing protein [Oscillospiraceae bacterium]MBR0450882.1 EAL domain-containing protein [Oscillospiraceae bacterium]
MPKNPVNNDKINRRRLILIVDDEQVNRELLGMIASTEFDILYAANGIEALDIIRKNVYTLSLVILDLMMPEMDGFEVLKTMQSHEEMAHIPVIILTSDKDAEVQSLKLGAADFIIKPFHSPEVILARIERTIELSEDRFIIQTTERENLTGLLTKEYFFRYADQYDRFHPEDSMDAVALDIIHFHMINEMYGRNVGDEILIHFARFLREEIIGNKGLACRLDADRFLLYLPHIEEDYQDFLDRINRAFDVFVDINVRVRCGIYANADKELEIEKQFDRALHAVSTVKDRYDEFYALYDDEAHDKQVFSERLVNGIDEAIANKQFLVYFQPKYDVSGDTPKIISAEALVRWKHPEYGMISPGLFIPLFESNGLIHKLDFYIWEQVAEKMRRWKEEFGAEINVSVNVSRIDLHSPDLEDFLEYIVTINDVDPKRFYLEITESAYTEDGDRVTQKIFNLRDRGFQIEMDDFGTGYSSLNMLADVPVDVLKLDMKFIQHLRSSTKNEILISLIINAAKALGILTVAEGVEEKDQVDFLKGIGCNIIQGYYFSRPLPEQDFLELLKEN